MTAQELVTIILVNTFTRSDLNRRIHLLREYLEQTYFSQNAGITLHEFMENKNISASDAEAMSSWGDQFYKCFTRDTAYDTLKKMGEYIDSAQTLVMYLPYLPDPTDTIRLGRWVRTNVQDNVIIEMKRNPSLIGGCALVWKGIYRDYSMKYFLMKHRDAINSVLDEYKLRTATPPTQVVTQVK